MSRLRGQKIAEPSLHVNNIADGAPGVDVPLEPAAAAFGAPRPRRRRPAALTGSVNVIPDQNSHLGLLSYLVPDGMTVRPGDAVRIPYGKKEVHGMVAGPGDHAKATRPLLEVFGVRSDPSDISLAYSVAKYHFVDPASVLTRIAPKKHRGADALPFRELQVSEDVKNLRFPAGTAATLATSRRTLLVRAPATDPSLLAAHQAWQLAFTPQGESRGQVLVLCPTQELVTRVVKHFGGGAARLDSRAARGAWKGFVEGTVTVGVGTRSAALYAADHLAGIVVVDEDHPGHLEQTNPITHARDLASARTRALRIPLRLISAVPTPQAVGAVNDVVEAGFRNQWPRMVFVNRDDLDPTERFFPARVKTALSSARRDGHEPVVLAPNAKTRRKCSFCGQDRPCSECSSSLCKHLDETECPACGSSEPAVVRGWDKDRLAGLLGDRAKVVTIGELSKVRDPGVVVVFDVDTYLGAPDLIPGRWAASVLQAAAQCAGKDGLLVVMGRNDSDPLLADLLARRDLSAVGKRFYHSSRSLSLPPFGRLVRIVVNRAKAPDTRGWVGHVHGPRKLSGRDWEILVRVPNDKLHDLEPHIRRFKRGGKVRVQVD